MDFLSLIVPRVTPRRGSSISEKFFSHFYRGGRIITEKGDAWSRLRTRTYGLDAANEALDDVARGVVVKGLIEPGA
ncbi:MAG TPA: hypothetical protein VMM12_06680 [Longimicrobiales bacterium]|nr:hypothetical protein [Longimicrobiales bacterium]